jgi:3-methyladenine DNA glycosylase AlkD
MVANQIIDEIKNFSSPELAVHHLRFFKTGKDEYGEGDLFYGLKVPDIRKISKKHFNSIDLSQIDGLIKHPYHEVRLTAIVMLILKNKKASFDEQEKIYNLYLNNVNYINNWDLVDISAHHIIGAFLFKKNTAKLWELARSGHLWSERISVVSTFYFIRQGEYSHTLELSKHFLNHKHDLIHKATGWMLREVGKRDVGALYSFLDENYKIMPRTMLRYSIEKISPDKRALYMQKNVN